MGSLTIWSFVILAVAGFAYLLTGHLATSIAQAAILTPLAYLPLALRREFRRKPPDPLDEPLFHWPDGTAFKIRQMGRSVECKGITGSGKTSGTLQHFLECLAAHPRASIFMITQKPEDRGQVVETFRRAGRSHDLLIVDKDSKLKCNFYQYMSEAGFDNRAMVEFNNVVNQMLQGQTGTDREPFWAMSADRLNSSAFAALSMGDKISAANLLNFYSTALYDPAVLNDDERNAEWRAQYHNTVIKKAAGSVKTPAQAADWSVAMPLWTKEFPHMSDRLRGSIMAHVMNPITTANTGLASVVTSTTNTLIPDVLDQGRCILIDFPFSEWGPTGRYIAGGWKYIVQRHMLKRQWDRRFFNVMIFDEYQEVMTDFDALYLAQCRSHGGSMLCLTQTVNSEFSRMEKYKASMLLANFGTHIYHLGDSSTEDIASKLVGSRRERFVTVSDAPQAEAWDTFMGHSQPSASVSEQYQPVLQPGFLQHGALRTGGPPHYAVDGLVIIPGQQFKSGESFQYVTFHQRR